LLLAATLLPSEVRAQSFGRDAEASRLVQTGNALAREEERLGKTKAWLEEQNNDLERREASYRKSVAVLKQMVDRYRCRYGVTLKQCLNDPPPCPESRDFQRKALVAAELLEREKRAISVQNQRLNELALAFGSQRSEYYQRLDRYKADRRDFDRRYRDGKQLTVDDSIPKASSR
jgi:hypothetical protein